MNKNISAGVAYVFTRATAEISVTHCHKMTLDHVFLGLLKVAELSYDNDKNIDIYPSNAEIDSAKVFFQQHKINTSEERFRIRHILEREENVWESECQLRAFMGMIIRHADSSKQKITIPNLLEHLLICPSELIFPLLFPESVPDEVLIVEQKHNIRKNIRRIKSQVEKLRLMRNSLLGKIFGQEKAIYDFCDGIFAAELLSGNDSTRKQPKASFVFAGPPGVGKTYLAEECAALLQLPVMKFDMSSYSDKEAHLNLIGYSKEYHCAHPGLLTKFVNDNPECILIFDEIEKAHQKTINLFLQILDSASLHDDYMIKDIDFQKAIIVFTTNAGHKLYENETNRNKNYTKQTIISALEEDIDPKTNEPFFPPEICSRLSSGWLIMFNNLTPEDLKKVSDCEIKKFANLIQKNYSLDVTFDPKLPAAMLFSEGCFSDARQLRSATELFCETEFYSLWRNLSIQGQDIINSIQGFHFGVNIPNINEELMKIFVSSEVPNILLWEGEKHLKIIQENLPDWDIISIKNVDDAIEVLSDHEPLYIIADLIDASDTKIYKLQKFILSLSNRMVQIPVIPMTDNNISLNEEQASELIRSGCSDYFLQLNIDKGIFTNDCLHFASECYINAKAAHLGKLHKILKFKKEYLIDGEKAIINIIPESIEQFVDANDINDVVINVDENNIRFSDVIGAKTAKEELRGIINYIKNPIKYLARGINPPKGILLYGEPGTGKTLLAKAMAGEAGVPFLPVTASNFITKLQGSGSAAIRELFTKARSYAPSVIFIDEIDSIGRQRGELNRNSEDMALNTLLTEMDGFNTDPRRPVIVIAATNFSPNDNDSTGKLDEALLRRFDRIIQFDLPGYNDRLAFLKYSAAKISKHHITQEMLKQIASRSSGTSLSILASVINLAGRLSEKQNTVINDHSVEEAFEEISFGVKKVWSEQLMRRIAVHEAGHVLVSYISGVVPDYVTIVSRGNHGGYTQYSDKDEKGLLTFSELQGRLRSFLGGRAAELVYYGEIEGLSTGPVDDLKKATEIVRSMICSYGMDNTFGLAVLDNKQFFNEKTMQRINEMLQQYLDQTIFLIKENRMYLDALVSELLRNNKLSGPEISLLLHDIQIEQNLMNYSEKSLSTVIDLT